MCTYYLLFLYTAIPSTVLVCVLWMLTCPDKPIYHPLSSESSSMSLSVKLTCTYKKLFCSLNFKGVFFLWTVSVEDMGFYAAANPFSTLLTAHHWDYSHFWCYLETLMLPGLLSWRWANSKLNYHILCRLKYPGIWQVHGRVFIINNQHFSVLMMADLTLGNKCTKICIIQ